MICICWDILNEHTWHYSVGENLTNIIGLYIGKKIFELQA